MEENPYQPSPRRCHQFLPAHVSEERAVLGVYAVSVFAAVLGLVLLHFR